MDRRLSNVQLQQHLYEAEQQSQLRNSCESPRPSVDRTDEHRRSIVQQPKSTRSSVGRSDSVSDRGNDVYQAYYMGYVGQTTRKRRRATLWETLTGLVCSLGALATRAAKMAARRGDPL
ncbi:hypothetical protein KPH14_011321 [Odynerus spinipes]|uniref:Uncharacterized protein n=1 Tax=Odynerus spinipes TaxID=1348599 RepID=A0AAD9R9D9_9HYME|nr:hypothetical protein KPH14_011321 [Odynerus spinipes]